MFGFGKKVPDFSSQPITRRAIPGSSLRKGMWVADGDSIGILVDVSQELDEQGRITGEVHKVDENGDTTLSIVMPLVLLRQATLKEIPAPRRPSKQLARSLGYL